MEVATETKQVLGSFKDFRLAIGDQVKSLTSAYDSLYMTDVSRDDLWAAYLAAFPEGTNPIYRERTEHDCSACRQFIKNMGNVVAIGLDKRPSSSDKKAVSKTVNVSLILAGCATGL